MNNNDSVRKSNDKKSVASSKLGNRSVSKFADTKSSSTSRTRKTNMSAKYSQKSRTVAKSKTSSSSRVDSSDSRVKANSSRTNANKLSNQSTIKSNVNSRSYTSDSSSKLNSSKPVTKSSTNSSRVNANKYSSKPITKSNVNSRTRVNATKHSGGSRSKSAWNKKRLVGVGIASTLAVMGVSTALYVTLASDQNSTSDQNSISQYQFDGQTFKTQQDALDYADNNVKDNMAWQDGSQTYNNVAELGTSINDNIQPISGYTTSDNKAATLEDDGSISAESLAKISFDQKADTVAVYDGASDSIYKTKTDAQESYLQIHNAYYFNNIYFHTLDDLYNYLVNDYIPNGGSPEASVRIIGGPNGSYSHPIDYSSPDAKAKTDDFVDSNYKSMLEIKNGTNSYQYADTMSINEVVDAINPNDIDYTHMYSTGGKSEYIVDTSKDDDYTLTGPYLYEGHDITSITNPNMWTEIAPTDSKVVDTYVNDMIGNFFGTVFSDSKDISDTDLLFNAAPMLDTSETYMSYLKSFDNETYNFILGVRKNILSGKRNNNFYDIPAFYSSLLEHMVIKKRPNVEIDKTRDYFKAMTDYYNQIIQVMMPQSMLTNVENGDVFNLTSLFGFDKTDFNYAVGMEYYTDILKQQYPNLIASMELGSQALINASTLHGVLPFNKTLAKDCLDDTYAPVDYRINKDKNNDYIQSEYDGLEQVWNNFSSTSMDDFDHTVSDATKQAYPNYNEIAKPVILISGVFDQAMNLEYNDENSNNSNGLNSSLNSGLTSSYVNVHSSSEFKSVNKYGFSSLMNASSKAGLGGFDHKKTPEQNYKKVLDDLSSSTRRGPTGKSVYSAALTAQSNLLEMALEKQMRTDQGIDRFKVSQYDSQGRDVAKQVLSTMSLALNSVSGLDAVKDIPELEVALKVMSTVLAICSMFMFTYKHSSYIYTTTSNVSYVWDGGVTKSRFFGLITEDVSTINDMKMNDPIQLNAPRNMDYLYYNGNVYDGTTPTTQLKEDYARDIIEGTTTNKDITTVYTLKDDPNNKEHTRSEFTFNSEAKLEDDVYGSMKQVNDNKYSTDNNYTFANGTKEEARKIVDEINPVQIVQLPEMDKNNYAIDNSQTYITPGDVYNGKTNKIETEASRDPNNEHNYIILDPNTKANKDKANADVEKTAHEQITKQFNALVNVKSKNVLKQDLLSATSFNALEGSTSYVDATIYQVETYPGDYKYFNDYNSAANYYYSFKDYVVQSAYYYDNMMVANSEQSFHDWVLSNTEEVK